MGMTESRKYAKDMKIWKEINVEKIVEEDRLNLQKALEKVKFAGEKSRLTLRWMIDRREGGLNGQKPLREREQEIIRDFNDFEKELKEGKKEWDDLVKNAKYKNTSSSVPFGLSLFVGILLLEI